MASSEGERAAVRGQCRWFAEASVGVVLWFIIGIICEPKVTTVQHYLHRFIALLVLQQVRLQICLIRAR